MARKIEFYTDEHVAGAIVRGLRQRGVDVWTAAEEGMLGASDLDHVELARAQGRVIITHDDDFLRLHAAGTRHAGIVYAPQQMSVGDVIRRLMLVCEVLDAEEMEGHLEFL